MCFETFLLGTIKGVDQLSRTEIELDTADVLL
jgi:hypothetical protein